MNILFINTQTPLGDYDELRAAKSSALAVLCLCKRRLLDRIELLKLKIVSAEMMGDLLRTIVLVSSSDFKQSRHLTSSSTFLSVDTLV